MAEDTEQESRTQPPTGRRLERARAEGQVAKSSEVAPLAALAAATVVVVTYGGALARGLAQALIPFLAHPDAIDLSGRGAVGVMHAALAAAAPVGAVMLAAMAAGVAGNLIQHGFLFVPAKLAPKFDMLNPLQGFKRLAGVDNLIHFAKTFVRFLTTGLVVWLVLRPHAEMFGGLVGLDPAAILPLTMDWLRAVLVAVLLLMTISAGLDWFIQRQRFMFKMRMTREEVKQELKDTDGDPHLKNKLKQIRFTRAKRRIIQNVPKATLVITNPTHFAVALRYVQGETAVPICVAKGADELALRIREVAREHAVPVVEDPPLARALYAAIDIDETIPREHYQAVAKIIGFVMSAASRGAAARRARSFRPPRRTFSSGAPL